MQFRFSISSNFIRLRAFKIELISTSGSISQLVGIKASSPNYMPKLNLNTLDNLSYNCQDDGNYFNPLFDLLNPATPSMGTTFQKTPSDLEGQNLRVTACISTDKPSLQATGKIATGTVAATAYPASDYLTSTADIHPPLPTTQSGEVKWDWFFLSPLYQNQGTTSLIFTVSIS